MSHFCQSLCSRKAKRNNGPLILLFGCIATQISWLQNFIARREYNDNEMSFVDVGIVDLNQDSNNPRGEETKSGDTI